MSFRMIRRAAVLALSGLAVLSLSFAVSAQSYQALVPFLIDLPQWQGEKPDGMSMQAQGQEMSWATRAYKRGDAELSVMVGVGHPLAAQAEQMTTSSFQSEETSMETGPVRGFQVARMHTKADKSGMVMVMLSPGNAKGAMLMVQYTGLEPRDALALAERFDWAAMQRAGRR